METDYIREFFKEEERKKHQRKLEQRRRKSRLALERKNNPDNELSGSYTGRCPECGSSDLWDDNLAYGCNNCGFVQTG